MKVLQSVLFALLLLMPLHLLAGPSKENQIETLLEEALFNIEEAKTFDKKLKFLMAFETDLHNLDEIARGSEYYDYVLLTELLAVVELPNLTEMNCTEAFDRIGQTWEPTSEMPRLSGLNEMVYDIVQHLCLFDAGSH